MLSLIHQSRGGDYRGCVVIKAHQCRAKPEKSFDNKDGFLKKVTVAAANAHDSKQVEPVLTVEKSEVYADKAVLQ